MSEAPMIERLPGNRYRIMLKDCSEELDEKTFNAFAQQVIDLLQVAVLTRRRPH
jgi:hypothetical protein